MSESPVITFSNRKRVAVFASYTSDRRLPPQVLSYLAGLRLLCDMIVVVFDNELSPAQRANLEPYCDHVISGRHGEYDFGSYKRGVNWAFAHAGLETADELILCNDSCFGPVGSFQPMFARMEERNLDFWGGTDSTEISYHLQSYFVVLTRRVFTSEVFKAFLAGIKKQPNVRQVILKYELGLTKTLCEAGFLAGALVENRREGVHPNDPTYRNITLFPLTSLLGGLPLVKVKALRTAHTNADGPNRTLAWLKASARDVYDTATRDLEIKQFEDASDIAFSMVMPTRNRAWCISKAIISVLEQTHRNFELVVVDDGSTDGTRELIEGEFGQHLSSGRIKYIHLTENVGTSGARNIGVAAARNPWIGYIDSDNQMRPYFLTMIANGLIQNRKTDAIYARAINVNSGLIIGRPFDRARIVEGNFVDLGVFVHRKILATKFGGFDPDLRRLVDWDVIIRYTRHMDPVYIPHILLNYLDGDDDQNRISVSESYLRANIAVKAKHNPKPTVSTIILSYNHQEYITEAIESALSQKGAFEHEILLADDGSNDGTARIVARYAEKYPKIIRNISHRENVGISENYRHCFRSAAGNFIAVLEGDDYWTSSDKNMEQAMFLTEHPEATMVFSRIRLLNMASGAHRLLNRQENLAPLFTAAEFAKNEYLNLIANFSSTMFRKSIMIDLPSMVYEPRLNEITLSFYLDRLGKFGFIDNVMGTYRLVANSMWTGASQLSRLEQAVAIRESALRIAKTEHRPAISRRLDQKRRELTAMQQKLQPIDRAHTP